MSQIVKASSIADLAMVPSSPVAMVQMTRLAGVIILDHLTFSTARRVLICGFPSRLLYRKESRLMTQLTIRIRPPMLGLDTGCVWRSE